MANLHDNLKTDMAAIVNKGYSFTILIIISILFDPFFRCMLLSEKRCHSLFIRLFNLQNPIKRKSIFKSSKLFSNHSSRLKIS